MQPDNVVGDDDGTTFMLTTAGQVQYTTGNYAGANGVHNVDYSVEGFNV